MRDLAIHQISLTKRPVLSLRLSNYLPITFDFLSYFPERLTFNTKFVKPIILAFSLGSDPTKSRFKYGNNQKKTAAKLVGQFPTAYISNVKPEVRHLYLWLSFVRSE